MEEVQPSIIITEQWSESDQIYAITLNRLMDEVMQRYQFDKQALHQFSYYLLLKSQQFSQNDLQDQMPTK